MNITKFEKVSLSAFKNACNDLGFNLNNIEEILPLEKDDKLYLYLTNKNNEKSVLEYDAKTNKLS